MSGSEIVVRALAQCAAGFYVAALLLRIDAATSPARSRWSRVLWTFGCIVFVLHVVSAFAVFHHWSHHAAYEHTARRTAEVTGWNWGGGLYFNELFTVIWIVDVAWWWLSERTYLGRPRSVDWGVHVFMAFMFFNSVVVFGPPATRVVGIIATALVLFVFIASLWSPDAPQ